jgi:sigma-E factor negative regulatory protein RseC
MSAAAMLEEQARVVAVADGLAWVEVQRRSACGGCSSAGGCGTAAVAGLFPAKAQCFPLRDSLGLQVGDRVAIGIDQGAVTCAALAAYLLPLLTLILAGAAAAGLGAGDGVGALAALAGLGLGLWLAGRLAGPRNQRWQPVVLRRLGTETGCASVHFSPPHPASRGLADSTGGIRQ